MLRNRFTLLVLVSLMGLGMLRSQGIFPVKVKNQWGLINTAGELIVRPRYEAIGEFKQYGYAVMQREGKVGLLDRLASEIIPPQYEDLKILDSTLFAVMDQGSWQVVDLKGHLVLPKGYEQLVVWPRGLLSFKVGGRWGVVNRRGEVVIAPQYDAISLLENHFFSISVGAQQGVLSPSGKTILPPVASAISVVDDSLIFYRQAERWGAVNQLGANVIPPEFQAYNQLSANYFRLYKQGRCQLYSRVCRRMITAGDYEDYYPLTTRYVIVKKNRRLGLLDWCGQAVLAPVYHEILLYQDGVFRVNKEGSWALVKAGDEALTPFQYAYIAPPQGGVSAAKRNNRFGAINSRGEEIIPPAFVRLELETGLIRAFSESADAGKSSALQVFRVDEKGNLEGGEKFERHFSLQIGRKATDNQADNDESHYVMRDYEWFYAPAEERWGLRRITDGSIQLAPLFQTIKVETDLGITLVGMPSPGDYDFERTTFRMDFRYGIVNNELGAVVSDLNYWDIQLEDFREGNPLARCWLTTGRYGLVDRNGRLQQEGFAYIGPFRNGLARASRSGRLSGSLKPENGMGSLAVFLDAVTSPVSLVDYTNYDQIFRDQASVICENCRWGYLDQSGAVAVPLTFQFAEDLVNEVGLVCQEGKWGAFNKQGRQVIPCRYDDIHFLENTGNRMLRLYIQRPKYGLVDTLGQLAVHAVYDEIGSFSEGRLAVMRNGLWGYADQEGTEIIPCRFRAVGSFQEGLAAAQLGKGWGYIDKLGQIVIDFRFRRVGPFVHGLARVELEDGRLGYINAHGAMEIEGPFVELSDYCEGVARVKVGDKYGLLDTHGRFVLRPKYYAISPFNAHGLAIASLSRENDRQILINRQGEPLSMNAYREIQPFSEGFAVVRTNVGYGFVDTTGRLVIGADFTSAQPFSEGRAAVYQDGNCGYVTRTGLPLTPLTFTRCLDFAGGRAVVYRGIRRAGLVDTAGTLVLEPQVNRLLDFSEGRGLVRDEQFRFYYITEDAGLYQGFYQKASSFQFGVAVVQINDKWGIINRRGMELISPKYSQIDSFKDGYAKVRVDGFTGLSTLEGEVIVEPDFELISYAGNGLFRVEQGDKVGYFNSAGDWVWSLTN